MPQCTLAKWALWLLGCGWCSEGEQWPTPLAKEQGRGCRCGWGGWMHAAEDYIHSCGSTLEVVARTVHSASARFLKPVCMEGRCVRLARKSLQLVSIVCCALVGSFISCVDMLTSGAVAKACPALRLVLSLCAAISEFTHSLTPAHPPLHTCRGLGTCVRIACQAREDAYAGPEEVWVTVRPYGGLKVAS